MWAWEVSDDERITLRDDRGKHIRKLKKSIGDRVRVGVIDGDVGEAEIVSDEPTLRLLRMRPLGERRYSITILLGMPYPKVIKSLWAVLSAMGVDRIIYAPATLSEPDFAKTSALEPEVYEALILEGLAQAEDTRRPRVDISTKPVVDLLDSFENTASKLVLHVGASVSIRHCIDTSNVVLAIGPERGWTDDEATAFLHAGFRLASLGPGILRSDTAAISAVALARDALL